MKPNRTFSVSLILLLTILSQSCILNIICIQGDGVKAVEERSIGTFDGIINATQADVVFETGPDISVTIEADANLQQYFSTSVRNGILEIDIKGTSCIKCVVPAVVRITAPSIESFSLSGSGDMVADMISGTTAKMNNSGSGNIVVDYVESPELSLKLSGSGDISILESVSYEIEVIVTGSGNFVVSGDATIGTFTSTGSGMCFCSDLFLNECNALVSGSGDIYISVSENLYANLSGSGNLYYYGSPDVNINRTGSGNLIPLTR